MNYSKFHSRDYILPEESENPSSPETTPSQDSPDNRTRIKKKNLINKLNYIHFNDGTILVKLKHKKYDSEFTLEAKPQPCLEDHFECRWVSTPGLSQKLKTHVIQHLLISDGFKLIYVEGDVLKVDEQGLSIELPEFCYELSSRKVKRHICTDIDVEFAQNGVVFHGILLEFSPLAFKIEINMLPSQNFHWIRPETVVNLTIKDKDKIIYCGECKIIKNTQGDIRRDYILKPSESQINRFKSKEFRSLRQTLNPTPTLSFKHPIIRKDISLQIHDISGSGFSVEEITEESVLMPGMVIHDLKIEFINNSVFICNAQVVYKNVNHINELFFARSGLAILDIDNVDQVKILNILHQAYKKESFVSNKVDLDKLWEFFFESGFLYPNKYKFIYMYADKIKDTYKKIYDGPSNISRHFVCQYRGQINAHMSMLRFYNKSWLIHHHASTKSTSRYGGMMVLEQIGRLTNESYQLTNNNMDFLLCYYTSDNRFPKKVFGGFKEYMNNPKACSIDSFAYFHFGKHRACSNNTLSDIYLSESTSEDLQELEHYYEYFSGGLMIEALDLKPDCFEIKQVSEQYSKKGLKRERYLFSLKKEDMLIAVIMVNLSDFCLNLSNLTNCAKIIILNNDKFKLNHINLIITHISKYFQQNSIPFLIYPKKYFEKKSIPLKKIYDLWVINLQYSDDYLRYMEKYII